MKISKSILGLIFFFILNNNYFGQNNEYTVITKSGEVYLLDESSLDQKVINDGDKLNQKNTLQIGKDGYVVLADTNLQTIEIAEEGLYNINGIDTIITMKHNSISRNITNFIMNEMSTNDDKYNEMRTLGAVVRKSESIIEPSVPNFGFIMDSVYTFKWHPLYSKNKYLFRLHKQNGNTLYMKEVGDTLLTLDLSNFNLHYNVKYYWNIFDITISNQQNDSVSFIVISPNERKILADSIANLKRDFLTENSPLNYFMIAKYLQSKKLNEYAIEFFEKSIELAPNIEFYWAEYMSFLMGVGLYREAIKIWYKSPFNNKI